MEEVREKERLTNTDSVESSRVEGVEGGRTHNLPFFFIVQSCAESLIINVCKANPPFLFFHRRQKVAEEEEGEKGFHHEGRLQLAGIIKMRRFLPPSLKPPNPDNFNLFLALIRLSTVCSPKWCLHSCACSRMKKKRAPRRESCLKKRKMKEDRKANRCGGKFFWCLTCLPLHQGGSRRVRNVNGMCTCCRRNGKVF